MHLPLVRSLDAQSPIIAAGDGAGPIGGERHAGDIISMPEEGGEALAVGQIPDSQRVVRAPDTARDPSGVMHALMIPDV